MRTPQRSLLYLRTQQFQLTQAEFAALLGVKRADIGSYEEGRTQIPKSVLESVVHAYNATFEPKITLTNLLTIILS